MNTFIRVIFNVIILVKFSYLFQDHTFIQCRTIFNNSRNINVSLLITFIVTQLESYIFPKLVTFLILVLNTHTLSENISIPNFALPILIFLYQGAFPLAGGSVTKKMYNPSTL